MARPTTDEVRIARTNERIEELRDAIAWATLCRDHRDRDDVTKNWAHVAKLAGNIQRDTRLLAGLGRGG